MVELREELRDAGLRRDLGPLGLGANVANTVIGSGIFILPAALAKEIGPAAPLAYVACAAVMAGVVICFAAGGSRVPTSGGPYGVVEAAFGPFAGFIAAVLLWLGGALATAGALAAVAAAAAHVWPVMEQPVLRALLILGLLAALTAVNRAGVASGAGLAGVMTAVKLVPLLLLLAFGVTHLHAANFAGASASSGDGFGRAMLLAIFAFQGLETGLGVSGEVRNPARNVPLGLIGAMAAITVLYIAIQMTAQGVLGPALAGSPTPLADAARAAWAPLGAVLLAGAAISMGGYIASDILSTPRLIFALGRDGFLPAAFGRLDARTGAPTLAILAHVAITAVLALTGSFVQLFILASLASVALYALGCVAAVLLQRRGVATAGTPLHVPGLEVAALVGIGGMAWLALKARPIEAVGLGGTLLAGAVLYLVMRRRRG